MVDEKYVRGPYSGGPTPTTTPGGEEGGIFKFWFLARLPPKLRSGGVGTYLVVLAVKNCKFSSWHFFKRL